jgi:hypothetical protein
VQSEQSMLLIYEFLNIFTTDYRELLNLLFKGGDYFYDSHIHNNSEMVRNPTNTLLLNEKKVVDLSYSHPILSYNGPCYTPTRTYLLNLAKRELKKHRLIKIQYYKRDNKDSIHYPTFVFTKGQSPPNGYYDNCKRVCSLLRTIEIP